MEYRERYTFRKSERLCSKKLISEIFERGNNYFTPLFRVAWVLIPPDMPPPAQIAISVPKKVIRSAVARNLIRRRIREAYRKNKSGLYDYLLTENLRLAFILIYRGVIITDYKKIELSLAETIDSLIGQIKQKQKVPVKEKQ
jgi:ribonuclease P protein component